MIRRFWTTTDAIEKLNWAMLALLVAQAPFSVIWHWYDQIWYVSAFSIQASFWTVITGIISANARRKVGEQS